MGTTRVCGETCHKAKHACCFCWCGGVFHGTAGAPAREAFALAFSIENVPMTEAMFSQVTGQLDLWTDTSAGDRWRAAIYAAVAARAGAAVAQREDTPCAPAAVTP